MAGTSVATVAAFSRHGAYIEDTPATIEHYGSIPKAIAAMRRAQMTHAWLRIHGRAPYGPATRAQISQFLAALRAANVSVAGWGWCQGDDPARDAAVALGEIQRFGLDAYLADIEPDNTKWTVAKITTFCTALRAGFHGALAVTSYPLIDWHEPALLKATLPYVDMVNPQIYWFHFPNAKMVAQFPRPGGGRYRTDSAADYTDLCLERWRKLMAGSQKPIVVSGQAYWGENGITQGEVEAKVSEFLGSWNGYATIAGFNWYSLGGDTTMSPAMLTAITAAKLGDKIYASGVVLQPKSAQPEVAHTPAAAPPRKAGKATGLSLDARAAEAAKSIARARTVEEAGTTRHPRAVKSDARARRGTTRPPRKSV
ncbi:MAG TPA: hypothetical protein VIM02_12530 [Rhizomicrobium sp.]